LAVVREVMELRVVLTMPDFDEAVALYRGAPGIKQLADWSSGEWAPQPPEDGDPDDAMVLKSERSSYDTAADTWPPGSRWTLDKPKDTRRGNVLLWIFGSRSGTNSRKDLISSLSPSPRCVRSPMIGTVGGEGPPVA
jgi:hypothetical protein